MTRRTSVVDYSRVINVSLSSIFHIGDSVQVTPVAWAIAVQRQLQLFYGDEGNFLQFPMFTMELPQPTIQEPITVNRYNASSFIKVNRIHVTSVAAGSVHQIGSTNYINSESRIKHIRQFHRDPNME
ncbi:hypothetical protein BKP35_13290 [Anaerobacillus arseniciselenatis]|uniref:Uncharacterized protein n=1 Tax=Anaerobacillus arseniciselenatis TaxID=85682 RepID=A0A1S2LC54_9BACI|nr:spore germination protein GerPE [Anaerobacillus arseniciselenatis]OIJ10089.1 hypothetical protein BKP35_13290 [Anaerobacillus arseniciselenatis]